MLQTGFFAAAAAGSKLSWSYAGYVDNVRTNDGVINFTNSNLGELPQPGQRRFVVAVTYASIFAANRYSIVTNIKLGGVNMTHIVSESRLGTNSVERRNGAVYVMEKNTLLTDTITVTVDGNDNLQHTVRLALFSIYAPAGGLSWIGNVVADYDSPYTHNPAYSALVGDIGLSWVYTAAVNTINGNSWPKILNQVGYMAFVRDFEVDESGVVTLDGGDGGTVSAIIFKPVLN